MVDPANTTRLEARLTAVGGRVKVIRYPKRAHADVVVALAYPFRWLAPALEDVTSFFNQWTNPTTYKQQASQPPNRP
jgi:hypothetical protein